MNKIITLLAFCTVITFAQEKNYTKANLEAVNLYQSHGTQLSAELINTFSVNIPKGNSEIVIGNISEEIKPETIQIGTTSGNVTIISKQFTKNYADFFNADLVKNPKLKRINDSIKIVEKLLTSKRINLKANAKTLELLDKNQTVLVGSNSSSVSELTQLTQFYTQKQIELSNKEIILSEEIKELKTKHNRLKKSLVTNANGQQKTAKGVLILNVMTSSNVSEKITLKYLTEGATWEPFYEIKVNSINEPLNSSLKAKINQNTGLDWSDVKLTLISGNYETDSEFPNYTLPWVLELNNPYRRTSKKYEADIVHPMSNVGKGNYSGIQGWSGAMPVANQLNISYPLVTKHTILSNGKEHTVNLYTQKITADYSYASVPNMNKKAFLVATIKDWSQYGFIQAKANIIFENMHIGETEISPDTTDEDMILTLGNDARVTIERKDIKNKSGKKFLSKFQERTITYDLIVKNNKKEDILIGLKDRIPVANSSDIKIELLETSNAKRDDFYNPILNWNLSVGSGKTKKVRVSYKITYPKNKELSNL